MTSYAIFLRGVNVGGVRIKMADLRPALAALPLQNVATLLATGNICCDYAGAAAELKSVVERCLRSTFGYDAWVVVLDGARLGSLVADCPYPPDSAQTHTYITLSSDPAILDELWDLVSADTGVEQTRLGPEATAWLAPVGGTLDSPFSKISSKPRYKSTTTTRNLRTMLKVLAKTTAA